MNLKRFQTIKLVALYWVLR